MLNHTLIQATCPECGHSFNPGESLTSQLRAQLQAEFEIKSKVAAEKHAADLAQLASEKAALAQEKAAMGSEVERQATAKAEAQIKVQFPELLAKAEAASEARLEKANQANEALRTQVNALKDAEAESKRIQADFDDFKKEAQRTQKAAELEVEREARAQGIAKGKEEAEQENTELKLQLQRATDQAALLQRKLEQKPSQELQGEAFEQIIEDRLARLFPMDKLEPVAKGANGADIKQFVNAQMGQADGMILFECKKATNWNAGWVEKARQDGRDCNATVVVIISAVLPKDVQTFGQVDGVWVCDPKYAIALAAALRHFLVEVSSKSLAIAGRSTRAELLWDYVTGPSFRAKVEAAGEGYRALRVLHEADKKTTIKRWQKQEHALTRIESSVIELATSISAIGGEAVGEFDEPDVLALEADNDLEGPAA